MSSSYIEYPITENHGDACALCSVVLPDKFTLAKCNDCGAVFCSGAHLSAHQREETLREMHELQRPDEASGCNENTH